MAAEIMGRIAGKPINGHDFYHSAEFKALCAKFNIAYGLPTKQMVLRIPVDGEVEVEHYYPARLCRKQSVESLEVDSPANVMQDTTTQHNEMWRTAMPPSGKETLG